jgi:hypothetical protein
VSQDIDAIYLSGGRFAVFAHLYHVANARFGDVKEYAGEKGRVRI